MNVPIQLIYRSLTIPCLSVQRLYKTAVNDQHNYTITSERPEITQAKINAANFSEVLKHSQYI